MESLQAMKAIRTVFLFLAFSAFTMPSSAQKHFVLDGKRTQDLIPFKKSRGLIIVETYINNKGPFNFILDTGVGSVLITDAKLKEALNLKFVRKIEISGLGEQSALEAYTVPFLSFSVGAAHCKSISAAILSEDVFDLSGYVGMPIHGLLGFEFFNSFVVKINYEASVLKVFNGEKPRLYKKGTKFPLTLIDNKPYIQATVETDEGKKYPLNLLIDSGSGQTLSLESYQQKPFDLPQKFIPANLGVGLSGNIRGFNGRIKNFTLGKYSLNSVVCSFPYFEDVGAKTSASNRNGSIGNPMLSRFSVVFDYHKHQVYLKPLPNYKKPFAVNNSGIELVASGDSFNHYLISRVEPQSAAEEFGVLVGDELVAINFRKVNTMSLSEIMKFFCAEDGRTLFIEIARGDEFIAGILKLKSRI